MLLDLATCSETLPGKAQVKVRTFCTHMSAKGLGRLRTAGLIWLFLISWTLRPIRTYRLIRAVVTERQDSRLDKSLVEMKRRLLRLWMAEPDLSVGKVNPY